MTTKVPSAGDYIAAKCTKCKAATNHTIVAMVGEKVVKVECNTCGSTHNYRGETKKSPATASRTRTTKPRAAGKAQRTWEELLGNADPGKAIPYSMNTAMKTNVLIVHPTFGLGQVTNIIRPNKMDVCFQSGNKLLRCKTD
ncbi:MAG: hypothetical protein GXP51_00930 [Deltaproteobacteria bacterium]|nr:hypothetical protein [Deltaproteobacteria bacterium]